MSSRRRRLVSLMIVFSLSFSASALIALEKIAHSGEAQTHHPAG